MGRTRVVLLEAVEGLGGPGDVVEVAGGYARNYLLPRGLALPATEGNVRHARSVREARAKKAERERNRALELASQLERMRVVIKAKAGEGGRLFGSITTQHVVEAVAAAGGPILDRRRIQLLQPIRSTGTHEARVQLHPEVEARLTLLVQGE